MGDGRQGAVARLAVDTPLPHLDRPFDYAVPPDLDDTLQVGSRVRIRFSGRLTDGWVLERADDTTHQGKLAPILRVVGDEPVLTPQTGALFRAVADRYAGTFADVVRLGVPARHARAETAASGPADLAAPSPRPSAWAPYRAADAFLAAVREGRPARAVWQALPGHDPFEPLAEAVEATARAGRGVVVVVPDARDLRRLEAAVAARVGPAAAVTLAAEHGPQRRYRRWLAVRRGDVRIVLGSRAAAYAPVADLGLVVVWDDGDDLHAEPRAPYPNTRDVLAIRSSLQGAAMLVGGFARTAETQQWLDAGWAHEIVADRATVRAAAPRVLTAGDDAELARDEAARSARLPTLAWRTARDAIAGGRPVLVQVPRRGYVPALACQRDRTPARCVHCHGPLQVGRSGGTPVCGWCGRTATTWACPVCGETTLRAVVIGSKRTAEELGRAFPGASVRTSGAGEVLDRVGSGPALVISTPGAEPVAEGGYGAALLLDAWALLGRPDLRASEETLRRWCAAASLVASDGTVVVTADPQLAPVQALVRWDPEWHAARELADRAELGFPPAVRMASLRGTAPAVADLLAGSPLPGSAEVIGPVGSGDDERLLVRVPRTEGAALAAALKIGASARSARKADPAVRIDLDPAVLG
ncbi:primosomal protein N' [Jatrophihabitans sp. YIM 134969]